MKLPSSSRRNAVLSLALAFAATACGQDLLQPVDPAPQLDFVPYGHIVQVCKVGPAGTYDFTISATGGDLPLGSAFTVDAGTCVVPWEAVDGQSQVITVNEVDASLLDLVEVSSGPNASYFETTESEVTFNADNYHGAKVVYYNRAPPPPDCAECKGGVTELTLVNNGAAGLVRVESEGVVFEGFVGTGESFTVYGDRDDGKLKKDIKVFVDGVEVAKIHTSCSKPIGPGAVFERFEVIGAVSKDNGPICPIPPPPSCQECKGGVIELTLVNNGAAGLVRVESEGVVFEGFVATGESFTIYGDRDDGKLTKDVKVFVDGVEVAKIHTSCSQPIGPGAVFERFEVTEAVSMDNGPICPEVGDDGEEPCDDLCEAGKPAVLTMVLTGDDCSATSHTQDDGKVTCADFGALAGDVRVVVTDKQDPDDNKANTWFDGTVSVGDAFDIDAAAEGEGRLKSNTWVSIYHADGTLLQRIQFHTSCSQPLELDNQFGGLLLTGFTAES